MSVQSPAPTVLWSSRFCPLLKIPPVSFHLIQRGQSPNKSLNLESYLIKYSASSPELRHLSFRSNCMFPYLPFLEHVSIFLFPGLCMKCPFLNIFVASYFISSKLCSNIAFNEVSAWCHNWNIASCPISSMCTSNFPCPPLFPIWHTPLISHMQSNLFALCIAYCLMPPCRIKSPWDQGSLVRSLAISYT